jgi:excisionase family DNA binding protein
MNVWQREMDEAAAQYLEQAEGRRRIVPTDAVADALEYVARDLRERARQLGAPQSTRSIPEYAAERGVSAATVRRWIDQGRLRAAKERGEWRIPAGEHAEAA